MKPPLNITITGAAGQIGYSLLPRIASGDIFGPDQPVHLKLLEIPPAMKVLEGIAMELVDCAFPLLSQLTLTDNLKTAFTDTQWALLVGSMPRKQGMVRRDLLSSNAPIFQSQGEALNEYADRSVRVLVVGNPANTNALIAAEHAPSLPKDRFTAMTRLDHNRSIGLLAHMLSVPPDTIKRMIIWGNHSDTMVPDISHVTITGRHLSSYKECSDTWYRTVFVPQISGRGGAVIAARGASSAMSAANAAVQHIKNWALGTAPDDWCSMGVYSTGEYGIPKGVVYSFPCICSNGTFRVVRDLERSPEIQQKMKHSADELLEEKKAVLV